MKKRFIILPAAAVTAVAALLLVLELNGNIVWTSAKRMPDKYSGTIEKYTSETDADGDGVDDQTDILQSALAYVQTHPKYRSKYYNSGYPDDGFGVCTDVVANAFRGAGYDLRELVDSDIKAHPDRYDIDEPDDNIDFRRVSALKPFFDGNAQSLTLDTHDTDEWQGGDIVVFKGHIGIVSDRRNADGVPYVIHHANPVQLRYEEDVLSRRSDIIGHYRFG